MLINEDCREHYPHYTDKCMGLWSAESLVRRPIKSLVVCVDYDDFLRITLPRNARHFTRTMVVTSTGDYQTQRIAEDLGYEYYATDVFYARGAQFNKGAAMEEGLNRLGRDGWICTWDCDIVMPEDIGILGMSKECLYGPYRRILKNPRKFSDDLDWSTLVSPTHPTEWAGYFHLFHSSATSLRNPPWYSVDWTHAGGCDSDFQSKFPIDKLRRTPFEVLHLGLEGIPERGTRVGRNWCGRVIPRIDTGQVHSDAGRRESMVNKLLNHRKVYGTKLEKLQ